MLTKPTFSLFISAYLENAYARGVGHVYVRFQDWATEVFEQKTQAAPGWQGAEESNEANWSGSRARRGTLSVPPGQPSGQPSLSPVSRHWAQPTGELSKQDLQRAFAFSYSITPEGWAGQALCKGKRVFYIKYGPTVCVTANFQVF